MSLPTIPDSFNNNSVTDVGDCQKLYYGRNTRVSDYNEIYNSSIDPSEITNIARHLANMPLSSMNSNKILCLHGGGQTAVSFRNDPGMTSLINDLSGIQFDFPESPVTNDQGIKNYVWIEDAPGGKEAGTDDLYWANESIEYLTKYVIDNGPYFGILGFSQGVPMALCMLAYTNINFKGVFLFCGYLPDVHNGLITTFQDRSPIANNAMVFLGRNDTYFFNMGQSLGSSSIISNSNVIIGENTGHYLPLKPSSGEYGDQAYNTVKDYILNSYNNSLLEEAEPEPEPDLNSQFSSNILEYENLQEDMKIYYEFTGTVNYINLEGGFYGIITNEDNNFIPINIQNECESRVNSNITLRGYIKRDAVSIYMWGELLYVVTII
tara:strand:+ start:67 stop:1203 length:1137 start_codon:yes stop_codon:yes gene_type:complete